jgi:hypothetical protein
MTDIKCYMETPYVFSPGISLGYQRQAGMPVLLLYGKLAATSS